MSQPYILRRDGRDYQAPDLESMRQWARDGRVLPADMVYSPKYQSWYRARDLRELRDVLPQNEPPPVAVGPAVAPPQQFWLRKGDRNYVANDLQTVLTWAEQGNISPDDFIYHPAYEKWFRAGDSPQLVSRFPAGLRPGHDPFLPVEDDPMASNEARRSTAPLASGGGAPVGIAATTDSTEPVSGAAAEAALDGRGVDVDARDVERADSLAKTVMDFRAADLHRMLRDKERAAQARAAATAGQPAPAGADGGGGRGAPAESAGARPGAAAAGGSLLNGRDPGWGRPEQGLFSRPLGPEPTGEATDGAGDGAPTPGASGASEGPAGSAERAATASARSPDAEGAAAERVAAERKEAERKEAERKEAERKEAERREAERKEAERKEAERKEAERKEAERREAERREAERRDAERKEAERKEAERKEAERKEAERKEAERKEAERKEAERKEAERKEAERKEAERLAAERSAAERSAAPRVPLPARPGGLGERKPDGDARAPVRPPPPPPEALGSEPTAAMQDAPPTDAAAPIDEDARFVDRTGVMKLFYDVARAYVVTKDLRPGELLETACKLPTTNDSFLGQGKKPIYMTLRKRIDEHIAGPLAAIAADLEPSNRPGYALLMHRAHELAAVLAEGERVIGQKGPDRVVVGNQGRPKMSPEEADVMLRIDAALKGLISVRDRSQAA